MCTEKIQPHKSQWRLGLTRLFITTVAIAISCSFSTVNSPSQRTAAYYDRQTDSLLFQLRLFQNTLRGTHTAGTLREHFLKCRNAYKRIEMFVDVFEQSKARLLNGPDLLRIDEDNPADSLKPHGFQVIESLLYTDKIDERKLQTELSFAANVVRLLRNDPDRIYFFSNERIWQAMRMSVYRIISLGVTGFDVPLSTHALPEARQVLHTVDNIAGIYHGEIHDDKLFRKGKVLLSKADAYLIANNQFNSFDRLTFVREYLNPISEWLMQCAEQSGYIRYGQREPLNSLAKNLFAADIMNIAFFSPNENYLATPERIALGKKLFYDPILSGNGTRSCASCHAPDKALTDGLPRPMDITGGKALSRNTPTLWNAALQTAQFYDSRTKKLENQLSAVVHNKDEMDGSLRNSIPRLKINHQYDSLFKISYSDNESITEYNIANAISSYVRSLTSLNSRFDRFMRHETDSFNNVEKNGFNLFMGKAKCGTCHYAPLFNGLTPPLYEETESEILGVPASKSKHPSLDEDEGKYCFTKIPLHKYAFKTSTVRNAALTAPYMHNGVFSTLEEVVDFYNNGGGQGSGIPLPTQTLPSDKLLLSKKEVKDIVAFLNTLTDTAGRTH